MDVSSSATEICLDLISGAFQRCRVSEDICRLSVILKSSSPPDPYIIRISISDTGIGSNLEEFNNLSSVKEAIGAQSWDGLLSVTTTGIRDNEVYYYLLNLKESTGSRSLTRLPSRPKNGSKFSGTEICLSISESIDVLKSTITLFFQKILIVKTPNVAIELVVDCEDIPGLRRENVFLANESNPFSTSNIERLKSGLGDYVLKHGNRLNQNCKSCFPTWEHLKIGHGMACSLGSQRSAGLIMEVAIIISELASNCPCFGHFASTTEVLCFEDFRPSPVSNQFLNALSMIDWKSYGMTLGNVGDQEGNLLEWENLPPNTRIAVALHCYHKQAIRPSATRKPQNDRYLIKKAVKLALDDLKEKHAGILLSRRAHKIRSFVPDLASSIAGLILSSNDPNFQEECLSLLGLHAREIGEEMVKDCIKEKITSVIDTNDRKSQKSKVRGPPFLFEDDCCWNSSFEDNEYGGHVDEGDDSFSCLD